MVSVLRFAAVLSAAVMLAPQTILAQTRLTWKLAAGGMQSFRLAFPAPTGSRVDLLVTHFGLFRGVPVR